MKLTILNITALLTSMTPVLALTIPGILPNPDTPPDVSKRDPASLRLGSVASIAIGFLFGSLFVVWIGLCIYHAIASLLRNDEQLAFESHAKSDAEKSDEEEKKSWGDSYGAGPVLGTIFGVTFALWGVLFVWNLVAAIEILEYI